MSKHRTRSFAIVFDLEFTAWEGSMASRWSRPNERAEIVQIGAVKVDIASLQRVDEFEIVVKPRLNPHLSDYLAALTGITNDTVQMRGVDFITAYRAFLDFVGDATTYAFGRDDLIFADNLKLYGWQNALPLPSYRNLIPWFAELGIDLKGKHACDVAEAVGEPFEGHRHDALADAGGVVAGALALIRRGAPSPFAPANTKA